MPAGGRHGQCQAKAGSENGCSELSYPFNGKNQNSNMFPSRVRLFESDNFVKEFCCFFVGDRSGEDAIRIRPVPVSEVSPIFVFCADSLAIDKFMDTQSLHHIEDRLIEYGMENDLHKFHLDRPPFCPNLPPVCPALGKDDGVNLSAPRPEGQGLPSTPAQAEGLKVHPEPRFPPRFKRRGFARSNG